jgi:hypothetical protein
VNRSWDSASFSDFASQCRLGLAVKGLVHADNDIRGNDLLASRGGPRRFQFPCTISRFRCARFMRSHFGGTTGFGRDSARGAARARALFETELIPAWIWPRLLLGGFVFFLVVELEKLIIRTRRSGVHSRPIRGNLSAA